MPEAGSRAGRAFIWYARLDAERVHWLRRELRGAGVRVWQATPLPWPVKSRPARIRQAVERDTLVFIACFSRAGLAQEPGYQNRELLRAIEQLQERPLDDPWLFPVRLDECEIPGYDLGVGRTLRSVHWADLFGDRRDEEADKLVKAVARKLGIPQDGRRAAGWPKPGWTWALIAAAAALVAGVLLPGLASGGSPGSPATPTAESPTLATPQPPVAAATGMNRLMEGARPPGFVIPSSPSAPMAHKYSGDSYHFKSPSAITADATHVWICNPGGNSVTELNASDGSVVAVLFGSRFRFDYPDGITVAGGRVWVTNAFNDTVTELNESDGTLVKILSDPSYGFEYPSAIAADGTHVWVVNRGAPHGSVTELNESDGTLVKVLSDPSYGFDGPDSIASDGTHVWIANQDGPGSVTELNAASGTLARVISGRSYAFDIPEAIASDGAHVWIANGEGNSVTELNAETGTLVRVVFEGSYYFSLPTAITVDGPVIWVANAYGDFLTKVRETDGKVLQILPTSSYAFNDPVAIAVSGTDIWVADSYGDYVTELLAD